MPALSQTIRRELTKPVKVVADTQSQIVKTATALAAVESAVSLSGDLKREVAELRRSGKALRTAIKAIPPIPAGPVGPAITVLKKTAAAVLKALDMGLKSVESALATADKATSGIRAAVETAGKALTTVESKLTSSKETLAQLQTLAAEKPGTLDALPSAQQLQIAKITGAVAGLAEQLDKRRRALADKTAELKPAIAAIQRKLTALKSYEQSLKDLAEQVKDVAKVARWVASKIKELIDMLPGFVQTAMAWLSKGIQWLLDQSGIQSLLNDLGRLASSILNGVSAALAEYNRLLVGLQSLNAQLAKEAAQMVAQATELDKALNGQEGLKAALGTALGAVLSGHYFRGDDTYRHPDPIGFPRGTPGLTHTKPWTHVMNKRSSDTSRYTSWATERAAAAKFSKASPKRVYKTKRADVAALAPTVAVWTPDDVVAELKKQKAKIKKRYSGVKLNMTKNKEVLLEGQIPGNIVKPT